MTTLTTARQDYLRDAIADEALIAKLLGYRALEVPNVFVNANAVIWGVRPDFKLEWQGQTGRSFLPQWRRTWDGAGELIVRCELTIVQHPAGVIVEHPYYDGEVQATYFAHPSKDDAIRFAMCKAAIAYLTAERAA